MKGKVKLFNMYIEDCIKTMLRIEDSSIDLVLTSPPYDNIRTYKEFQFHFKEIARNIARILKPGGVCVWVVGDQTVKSKYGGTTETLTSMRQALYFTDVCYLNMHDTMIYEKSGSQMPDVTRYLQAFEYMFVFSKGRPNTINLLADRRNRFPERWGKKKTVRERDGSLTERVQHASKEFGRRFNIWKFEAGVGMSTDDEVAFKHPAIFPENLAADHILSWTKEGDVVYDTFGGSATVPKVCEVLNRKWIMSEISGDYVNDVAIPRMEQHRKKLRLL